MKIFSTFFLITTLFINHNNLHASQARAQSSGPTSPGSWLNSWFVSAPTEQQKKIATIVGERAAERQKKLAAVLYDTTLLPEDLIKIIIVYDEKVFTQHTGAITALVVLSNGKLASASNDKTIKIWDVEGNRCTQTLLGHTKKVTALAAPGDNQLVSGASDFSIKIWDIDSGQCKRTIQVPCSFLSTEGVLHLSILSNNRIASISYDGEGKIQIWDLTTGTKIRSLNNSNLSTAMTILQDGTIATNNSEEVYTGGDSGYHREEIQVEDSENGNLLQLIKTNLEVNINNLALLPNNKIISSTRDGVFLIHDLASGRELKKINFSSWIRFF